MAKTAAAASKASTTTQASLSGRHASDSPLSAKTVLSKDGEHALDRDGAKASIEFAEHRGGWIAEFRFSLRSGLCWACTLPLTTSSSRLPSKTAAVSDAARRLLESLAASIAGDELTKSQRKSVDTLRQWASSLLAVPDATHALPLAGKRFLDLFAGIGGFHAALAAQGAECAGAVEIDANARETYLANHPGPYPMREDIRAARAEMFGRVDIVSGGFPCQSFSSAGDRAGFDDPGKGALFFELARLVGELAPSVAILENVAGLRGHDGGRTFEAVVDTLARLGYSVSTRLLNASDFGLPQMRERLFLVCVHDTALANRTAPFLFPKGTDATKVVADILELRPRVAACSRRVERSKPKPNADPSRIERVGLVDGMDHQGYRVASPQGKGFTLCANSGGPGRQSGLYLVKRTVRRLSARECARMQGFPESFALHANERTAMAQLGNSVAIPIVSAIAGSLGATFASPPP